MSYTACKLVPSVSSMDATWVTITMAVSHRSLIHRKGWVESEMHVQVVKNDDRVSSFVDCILFLKQIWIHKFGILGEVSTPVSTWLDQEGRHVSGDIELFGASWVFPRSCSTVMKGVDDKEDKGIVVARLMLDVVVLRELKSAICQVLILCSPTEEDK